MRRTLLVIGMSLAVLCHGNFAQAIEVSDLHANKAGSDVTMTWTTGTSPYRVLRSITPNFMSGNATVAQGVAVGSATDTGAAAQHESYFYQIVSSGDPDPLLFGLNPPRPVPSISLLSPAEGQPGTSVTISGTNFADEAGGTTVLFGTLAADVASATTTQIVVTAPPGTVTSDVSVCVADVCSNTLRFTVTFGPAFQSISSLAFEPGTGSLWVGDRGSGDTVTEILNNGSPAVRANQNEAFVSNVTPADGTGRVYFSNGLAATGNGGAIRFINSTDNSNNFLRNAGTITSDPVFVRGLAARDNEANVSYFLDGQNGTVRRVPVAGPIDTNWGNTAFSFNDPAGARFDSNGNLYVSSTIEILKIAPTETVSLLAGGLSGAAGMDISEDTGIPTLLVADRTAGSVYLVDTETGHKDLVGQGFTNPVAAAFTRDLTSGELYYDVAEPTRILRLPDPRVEFTLRKATPVLIHKYRPDDQFPSAAQRADRKIMVEATVFDAARPAAGVTLYFRLADPKDTTRYAGTAAGDNKGGPGSLSVSSALSDAAGKVRTELTITDTYAGDNYVVEASLQPEPSFKKIAQSGVFTAWKRAYVEYDRMYKLGEFISQTSGAGQAEPARVFVSTPSTFAIGNEVHVFCGNDGASTSLAHNDGEKRMVTAVAAGSIVLNTALTLSYPYLGPSAPGAAPPYCFVARISGGSYDVSPPAAELQRAFDDPFTEWKFCDGGGFIPAWTIIGNADVDLRTFFFFRNRQGTVPLKNHVQLVAAGASSTSPTLNGLTSAENDLPDIALNWSWVFLDTIPTNCMGCSAAQIDNFIKDVTVHELGHQWNVNKPNPGGHDSENAWNLSSRKCLMNETRNSAISAVARFHANLGAPTKDLYCIRGHVDDLNQDDCSW